MRSERKYRREDVEFGASQLFEGALAAAGMWRHQRIKFGQPFFLTAGAQGHGHSTGLGDRHALGPHHEL